MFRIAYDPVYAHPLPEGHRFPMVKYELIPQQLLREGIVQPEQFFQPQPAGDELVSLCHDPAYIRRLEEGQLSQKEIRRMGFPLDPTLVYRERVITQGSIDTALSALNDDGIGFNVAGGTHHAGSNWAEGFCLFNDQAVAASYLLSQYPKLKILMLDLDVHQGNGTAQIFRNEPRVFTCSMHGAKNFPFEKERSDLDVPLEDGTTDEDYLDQLGQTLEEISRRFSPDFVFYLSGVDILETDKLGKLKVSARACHQRDRMVFEFAKSNNLPVQCSMGGGYSARVKDIVDAHCATFEVAAALYSKY